jgi:hypothetical protein
MILLRLMAADGLRGESPVLLVPADVLYPREIKA